VFAWCRKLVEQQQLTVHRAEAPGGEAPFLPPPRPDTFSPQIPRFPVQPEPKGVSFEEITAAIPEADISFIKSQLALKPTNLQEVVKAWQTLQREVESQKKEAKLQEMMLKLEAQLQQRQVPTSPEKSVLVNQPTPAVQEVEAPTNPLSPAQTRGDPATSENEVEFFIDIAIRLLVIVALLVTIVLIGVLVRYYASSAAAPPSSTTGGPSPAN
jgi:hypothetical protein